MKNHFVAAIILSAIICILASFIGANNDGVSKTELGRLLFFEPMLSKDNTISCASCHKPSFAYSDTSAVSSGVGGHKGVRNTPSAMNLSLQQIFFWDGRAKSLEEQVLAPIENPAEMNLPIREAVDRLRSKKKYFSYFMDIFGREPNKSDLAAVIAAFERTLETSDSPFDNWKFSGHEDAITNAAKRGYSIFNGKAKCIQCHFGADFAKNEFRNIGLYNSRELNDSGRAVVTGNKEEVGKFKIPSLRNVAITAPYMHNGMFKTLGAVIDFYNEPANAVPDAINRDSILSKPLGLSKQEKDDLEAFLMSLTDKRFITNNYY